MKILVILPFVLFSFISEHKFYFSETLIEKKPDHHLEITIKVFEDDWTLATGTRNAAPNTEIDSTYFLYLSKNFNLFSKEGAAVAFDWVGFEKEGEFIYLYLETSPYQSEPTWVQQNILLDVFEDQKNLVNYRSNGITKSLYFLKETPKQPIQWP
jgi:hypothetical protein